MARSIDSRSVRAGLPGRDLIAKGLLDLSHGTRSAESFLVLIGAPRLRRLGLSIPSRRELPECPEHALYRYLQSENSKDAHSRYNALIRRLVSFERALEGRCSIRRIVMNGKCLVRRLRLLVQSRHAPQTHRKEKG